MGNAGETVNDVTKQIEDHVPTNYEIVPNTKVISTITFGNENGLLLLSTVFDFQSV